MATSSGWNELGGSGRTKSNPSAVTSNGAPFCVVRGTQFLEPSPRRRGRLGSEQVEHLGQEAIPANAGRRGLRHDGVAGVRAIPATAEPAATAAAAP